MEAEVGSIIGFLYKHRSIPVYLERIPEGMQFPSMYVPPPITVDSPFTSSAYRVSCSLAIKIFHNTTREAAELAEDYAYAVRSNRRLIPLLDEEGQPTSRYIRVTSCSVSTIDDGVAQLTISWDSLRKYHQMDWPKIMQIFTTLEIEIGG